MPAAKTALVPTTEYRVDLAGREVVLASPFRHCLALLKEAGPRICDLIAVQSVHVRHECECMQRHPSIQADGQNFDKECSFVQLNALILVHTIFMTNELETPPQLLERRVAIGARLREERERLGFSQQGLGEMLAVRRLAISRYEGGQNSPTAEQLSMLHDLGADLSYVISGDRRLDREALKAELREAIAAIDKVCQTLSSDLDGAARLELAYEMLEAGRWKNAR